MKIAVFFLFILIPFIAFSDDTLEVIEVLVPKHVLSMSRAHHSLDYVDDRVTDPVNRTIADELITIPGVSLSGQGGQFQSYAIRGFSRGRIRTQIDGIPIVTDRRAGNSASFISPELFNLAHVTKGPNSVLYGSQAMGGVVDLSTEMPEQTVLTISGQNHNEGLNVAFKQKNSLFTSGVAYQHANNDKAPNGMDLNTQFERFSAVFRHQREHEGLITTFSWLPSYGKNIGKSNSKYPKTQMSSYPVEKHSLLQIQVSDPQNWSAKVFNHYQNWDSETHRFERYNGLTKYQSHMVGGQFIKHATNTIFRGYWGVDWLSRAGVKINDSYHLVEKTGISQKTSIHNEVSGNENNVGVYGKTQWSLGLVEIDFGLRFDWLQQYNKHGKTSFDNQLSASASIQLPLTDNFEVSLETGKGFRFPTLTERFYSGHTPRGLINGNEGLRPETSIGSEFAMKWHANDNVELRSAIYHYRLDNYIQRYSAQAQELTYRNIDKASVYGLEAQLHWYFNENIEHIISFEQQTGNDIQGQTLSGLHPTKLNWTMLLTFDKWSFTNKYEYHFDADQVGPSEKTREQFSVWSVSLAYQINTRHSINVSFNNLTNETYYANFDDDAAWQPKRHFKLFSSWQF